MSCSTLFDIITTKYIIISKIMNTTIEESIPRILLSEELGEQNKDGNCRKCNGRLVKKDARSVFDAEDSNPRHLLFCTRCDRFIAL